MAPWTPAQLGTALKAWYYAPDIAQADASAVSSWSDKSGNGRTLTQGTGGNQPTYKTGIQNGLAVVRFDGSNDFLLRADTLGISAQPFTIAAMWKFSGISQALCQFNNDTGGCYTTGATTLGWNCGASISIACSQAYHVTVGIGNGASSFINVDGNSGTSGNAGATNPTGGIKVGSERTGTGFFLNGDIGEIVVTNTALSTTDRQTLEGYLAWGWGLQANLPGGHPYASAAPTTAGHTGLRYALGTGLRNRTLR